MSTEVQLGHEQTYYAKNREKILAATRMRRAGDPARAREIQRRSRVKHRERIRELDRAYRKKNLERERERKRIHRVEHPGQRRAEHLVRKYGVTSEWAAQTLIAQGGCCAICRRLLDGVGLAGNAPRIDHDHTTGRVRAILCNGCNVALGQVDDRPALLIAAAIYLWHHAELQAAPMT